MSDLNYDLVQRHLTDDSSCSCGFSTENAEHYLLVCPKQNEIKARTILKLKEEYRNIEALLSGNLEYTAEEIKTVFIQVENFINFSERFTWIGSGIC